MNDSQQADIAAIVLGCLHNPDTSEEFRFGRSQLLRGFPANAAVHESGAGSWPDIWNDVQRMASPWPDHAKVLMLRHPHQALAPGSVEAMARALHAVEDTAPGIAAAACHPLLAPAAFEPDYCTLRGMERYVQRVRESGRAELSGTGAALDGALACMVTARTLRSVKWGDLQAVWVPGAWTHDFSGYQGSAREEVIPLVPGHVRRVLDVGGGEGHFLRALKAQRGCETHLAEYSTSACHAAASHVDQVWPGDFLESAVTGSFDCITFLDVLEHTLQPLPWLQRARGLLSPGGCVVASIPNVGHWSVIADLLEGRWDYAPVGIQCVTHLRFYTRYSIEALFADAGFKVFHIEATRVPMPGWMSPLTSATDLAIDREGLEAYNWLVRAAPC